MTETSSLPRLPAPGLRLAHMSDIHFHALHGARPWQFLNKRLTGGANLLLGRSSRHQNEVTRLALQKIHDQHVDHLFLTGDLTNLALDVEFQAVRNLLEQHIGGPDQATVIPGNHDYYTFRTVKKQRFEHFFSPWMVSQVQGSATPGSSKPYPFVKFVGPLRQVALVGVNSCIPSAPGLAIGRVGQAQRDALAAVLQHPDLRQPFRLVGLHHHLEPPHHTRPHKEFARQLRDHREVMRVLKDGCADLVIHGHNHQFSNRSYDWSNGQGQMIICEAGSSSVSHFHEELRGGKYNLYDLEPGAHGRLRLARVHTWLYRPEAADFVHWNTEEH